jgi:hypothetical protein
MGAGMVSAVAKAPVIEVQVGERTVQVELGQPGPRLRRQRGDLGALVGRRSPGVVLVVRRLESAASTIPSNVRSSDNSRRCARVRSAATSSRSAVRSASVSGAAGTPAVYTEPHVTDR